MSQTYLIIGGAGFIGSNSAAYFLQKGHNVIIFDNFSRNGAEDNEEWLKSLGAGENLKVVRGDITINEGKDLEPFIKRVDYVLHLAAQVAVTTSVVDPQTDFLTNALGTFNVLEMIRKSKNHPSLIYSSTNKVYGGLEDLQVREGERRYEFVDSRGVPESQLLDFHSPYGCSKGAADQYVRDYSRIYNLKTVVCRQSCIFGPRQFGIEDQGWVAWFIIATVLSKDITIYGNGKQVRDLLYVEDLVKLFDMLFQQIESISGSIFNIGGGFENSLSLLEFLDILSEKAGRKVEYKTDSIRPGDQPIYISDISLVKERVGWQPSTTVNEGIEYLWRWVNKNKSLFC